MRTILAAALSLSVSLCLLLPAGACRAQPATTAPPPRVLGLYGATNFRDLGFYRTAGGAWVRPGAVYRSNALAHLTPDDAAAVDRRGIRAVIDLRTDAERRAEPDIWLHTPPLDYRSPKPSIAAGVLGALLASRTPAEARAGMLRFYAAMPDEYRPEYAAFFHALADGHLPLLVHCTAGKDRTGVASALLLATLGVPRATIDADYALTQSLLPAPAFPRNPPPDAPPLVRALSRTPPDVVRVLWAADPAYVEAALAAVDREYGSVDGYLSRALALSPAQIATLRQTLTTRTPP